MENYSFKYRFREIINISAPIILEQVFMTMMGIVNTMMVASVGEYAVSAASIVDSVSNIIIALFAALTTGGTIVVAQYIGKRDKAGATEASAQSVLLSVFFSLFVSVVFYIFRDSLINALLGNADQSVIDAASFYFFIINFSFPVLAITQTIFGVLRGSGNTGTPMLISIIMNAVNVLLGYILIFGLNIHFFSLFSIVTPSFGIRGAALALTLARFIGMVFAVVYIIRFSKFIRLNKLSYFRFNPKMQKVILGLGVPTSIESSLFQVGKLITQVYIISMGIAAMAANSIAGSIFGFINVPGSALSTGVMILVGQRVGRGETEDVEKTTMFAVKTGMVMISGLCLFCFSITGFLVSMYRPEPETAYMIRQILYSGYIATPLVWSISFVTPAALRATGDVKFTMYVAIASMWIFRIVLGYIFGILLGWGVVGVWCGMYTDWVVRGIIFYKRTKIVSKRYSSSANAAANAVAKV